LKCTGHPSQFFAHPLPTFTFHTKTYSQKISEVTTTMGRSRNHEVRKHFTVTEIPSTSSTAPGGLVQRASCNCCSHHFRFAANRAQQHLDACKAYLKTLSTGVPPQSKGPIDSYAIKMTTEQIEEGQVAAARAIYTSGRPFTLFESPEFYDLFNA
jgi:hypothetical protein